MGEMSIRRTVAVVDDDPSVLNAMQVLLEAHGFTAIRFSSAEDFLGRDPTAQIGCVLLDINLGGACGIALRRRLAADGCALPVIFMTASHSDAVRQDAVDAGCVDYLRKPFLVHELLAALAKALPAD